jgi:hypothetical protein
MLFVLIAAAAWALVFLLVIALCRAAHEGGYVAAPLAQAPHTDREHAERLAA